MTYIKWSVDFALYHCHRLKLFLYIKIWRWPWVFVSLRTLALVYILIYLFSLMLLSFQCMLESLFRISDKWLHASHVIVGMYIVFMHNSLNAQFWNFFDVCFFDIGCLWYRTNYFIAHVTWWKPCAKISFHRLLVWWNTRTIYSLINANCAFSNFMLKEFI